MFRTNDRVKVKKLKREGIIVEGPAKANKYLVAIDSLQYWLSASDLEVVIKSIATPKKKAILEITKSKKTAKSIDLHGLTAAVAEERVLEFISQAVLSNQSEVHIIHGIGSGKLKSTVHKILATTKAVSRFQIAPGNPGTTIAYL